MCESEHICVHVREAILVIGTMPTKNVLGIGMDARASQQQWREKRKMRRLCTKKKEKLSQTHRLIKIQTEWTLQLISLNHKGNQWDDF